MTDTSKPDTDSSFSSRMTRGLFKQAESLFDADDMDNKDLDERFSELSDNARAALTDGTRLNGDLVRLASLINDSGGDVSIDGSFGLSISNDRMSMSLSMTPAMGSGKPVTAKCVLDELRSRDITRGVLMNAIKQATAEADRGIEVHERVIVRGAPPIAGTDPWVVFFGRHSSGELEEIKESSLNVGTDEPVLCEQDDTIAYIREGDRGRPGYTANGETLPPPVSPNKIKLQAGRNVSMTGNCYMANAAGVIQLKDGEISVLQALVFNRDIDKQDSPLEFDGSIFIHGGVRTDVVISATEDIVIDRVVEGAQITSTGGNVVLRAGIAGRNKGKIVAAKDFIGGFVENAVVEAGNDITLHVGTLNSQLTANHDILAESGKGGIAGGVLIAGRSIHVKNLGSCVTKTDVIAGAGPRDIPALKEISQAVVLRQARLRDATEYIAQFDRAVRDPSKLSPKELKMYTSLHKLRVITQHELGELEERRGLLMAESASQGSGDVTIYQKLESNVQFHIGPLSYTHRESKGPLVLTYDPGHKRIICRNR